MLLWLSTTSLLDSQIQVRDSQGPSLMQEAIDWPSTSSVESLFSSSWSGWSGRAALFCSKSIYPSNAAPQLSLQSHKCNHILYHPLLSMLSVSPDQIQLMTSLLRTSLPVFLIFSRTVSNSAEPLTSTSCDSSETSNESTPDWSEKYRVRDNHCIFRVCLFTI